MRQKLRKFQESLGIFYLPALLGVTFLFLLILGWSNVQPTSYSFELNQVAKETVRAPKSVEDKESTDGDGRCWRYLCIRPKSRATTN